MPGWRNQYGQIRVGVNTNPRPIHTPIFDEENFYDGMIISLNCGSFTNYGTLTDRTPASGVTSVVTYTGGNGGSYPPQTIQSTGVTGLTANLQGGFFLSGTGTLTYTITGTASSSGTASFAINVTGKTCTLTRNVVAIVELIYNGNGNTGGSEPVTVSGSGDKVVSDIVNLTKEGYTFIGWNTSPYGTGTTYIAGSTITLGSNSITLYAIWDFIPVLTYNGNGNTGGTTPTSLGTTEQIVAQNGLEKTGYSFKEWNTNANGAGTTYLPGSTITLSSSVTLYAIWYVYVPESAFILQAQLLTGQVIDGTIATSSDYYRILYWDGTSEIKSSWTAFQKTNTSTPDGTMASYGPKTIKIWSCDQNGNATGYISSVRLENNKYLAFSLEKVTQLLYLTIKNNTVITTSDLNFSLLTDIRDITLENLPSFTGIMSLTNIPGLQSPTVTYPNGSTSYESKTLDIKNLPITSLNLGGHDGITYLSVESCANLTNINSEGCENLSSIDFRNNTNLQSSNFQQPYLSSLIIINSPNYTSSLSVSNYLTNLYLSNIGASSLDLSNLTSLLELTLEDMTQMDNTAINSLHNNNNLISKLQTLSLTNVTCPFIDIVSFEELISVKLHHLPNITAIDLPYGVNTVDIYRLPSVIPTKVDELLVKLDASGVTNGIIRRSQYNNTDLVRTHASDAALSSLIGKGWSRPNQGYGGITLSGL
jgi:uncharacterized repeat protein (TIGR02543 family)